MHMVLLSLRRLSLTVFGPFGSLDPSMLRATRNLPFSPTSLYRLEWRDPYPIIRNQFKFVSKNIIIITELGSAIQLSK